MFSGQSLPRQTNALYCGAIMFRDTAAFDAKGRLKAGVNRWAIDNSEAAAHL
jgi:hypothetical protein